MSDANEQLDGHMFGSEQPCFGCGPLHPVGFRLAFERDGDEVVTRFTPGPQYQGPPNIMHGGLVMTLADELAAWAIIAGMGKFGFTATVSCKLHGALRIGKEVVGRARIVKNARRIVDVGVSLSQDDKEAFSGEFRFVVLDRAGAEKMLGGPLPESWQRFAR